MDNAKKMMVVPMDWKPPSHPETVDNIKQPTAAKTKKTNLIRQKAAEKTERILKIILALAKINAYDERGRIRSGNGFLENSDIIALINHVIAPRKILIGEAEFINLLIEARIDPSLIVNENIKRQIVHTEWKAKPKDIIVNETKSLPNISYKRSIEEENDEEPLKKKTQSNWTIPYDSDDDF